MSLNRRQFIMSGTCLIIVPSSVLVTDRVAAATDKPPYFGYAFAMAKDKSKIPGQELHTWKALADSYSAGQTPGVVAPTDPFFLNSIDVHAMRHALEGPYAEDYHRWSVNAAVLGAGLSKKFPGTAAVVAIISIGLEEYSKTVPSYQAKKWGTSSEAQRSSVNTMVIANAWDCSQGNSQFRAKVKTSSVLNTNLSWDASTNQVLTLLPKEAQFAHDAFDDFGKTTNREAAKATLHNGIDNAVTKSQEKGKEVMLTRFRGHLPSEGERGPQCRRDTATHTRRSSRASSSRLY